MKGQSPWPRQRPAKEPKKSAGLRGVEFCLPQVLGASAGEEQAVQHALVLGQHAVGGDLLPMLLQVRSGFAAAFKVSLMSFQLDRREVLSAQTDRGWSIIFGQMVTSADRASLEPKLAALRSLSTRLDLTSAPIQYVNLENPGAPAVQLRGHK